MNMTKGCRWAIMTSVWLVAGSSLAGHQQTNPIDIDSRIATGGLGTVHSSNSDSTYIGCQLVGEQNKAIAATCGAKENANETLSCTTQLIEHVRQISGEGFIHIGDQDASGNCERTISSIMSYNKPKSAGAASGSTKPVTFSNSNNTVTGALGTVYNTADTVQFIGCRLKAVPGSSNLSLTCSAKNNANPAVAFDCASTETSLVDAARSIKDDSYLEITRNGSTCTKLLVKNDSRFAPKR